MRLLTALALTAAAVAARTAGPKSGPSTFSIKKITYQTNNGKLETEVCLNDGAEDLKNENLVTVGIKIEKEVTDYPAESVDGKCAKISASPPGNNVEVKYSFAKKSRATDESVHPENEATIGFTFIELVEDKITCGATVIKRTTIPNGGSTDGCLNADAEEGKSCYKEDPPSRQLEEGCQTIPNVGEDVFQYCQTPGGDGNFKQNDEVVAESLAYTGDLKLGSNIAFGGAVDVIVVSEAIDQPQVLKAADTITVDPFARSDATYRVCPVKEEFTAYIITDAFVMGTYEPATANQGNSYYQFGFRYTSAEHVKGPTYEASTKVGADESAVTVNCAPLTAGDSTRCYGYLPADGNTPLSLYYYDDDTKNVIIVKKDQLDPNP